MTKAVFDKIAAGLTEALAIVEGRAKPGRLHNPQPSKAEIRRFLEIFHKLDQFEATTRAIRGYGAIPDNEKPDQATRLVLSWLTTLAEK